MYVRALVRAAEGTAHYVMSGFLGIDKSISYISEESSSRLSLTNSVFERFMSLIEVRISYVYEPYTYILCVHAYYYYYIGLIYVLFNY